MINTVDSSERFLVARVFANLFRSISANWVVLLLFSAMLSFVSTAFSALSLNEVVSYAAFPDADLPPTSAGRTTYFADPYALFKAPLYWVGLVGNLLSSSFAVTGLMAGCLAYGTAARPEIGTLFGAGARNAVRVLGQTLIWLLALAIAFISVVSLLVFGFAAIIGPLGEPTMNMIVACLPVSIFIVAVALSAIWGVSTQAMVAEDIGVFASFARSRKLTRGLRLQLAFAYTIFFALCALMLFAQRGFSTTLWVELLDKQFVGVMMLRFAITTASLLFMSSFTIALYREVRLVDQGDAAVGLADVFS